ncbi:MAG: acyl-CoA dehydrogenase [Gemmatimonadota bacterium]
MKANNRLLLQFAPLIYVAWSDGIFTESELARIEARLASVPGAADEVIPLVEHWLNPAAPPTPTQLNELAAMMRKAARGRSVGKKRWFSLSDLGSYLARHPNDESAATELLALRTVEEALGIDGTDALNAMLGIDIEATGQPAAQFSPEALHDAMTGNRLAIRQRVFALLSRPEYALDPAAPHTEYRERVYQCCQQFAREGLGLLAFPTEYGGAGRVEDSIAAFETIAFHDLSLLVKFGVQFGLFGGSVYQLGTQRHHRQYIRAIGTLELSGCFAMTETGHGSNVRDIETTATFHPSNDGFVIHTPTPGARKDYIGNAAIHGRMATVFAQLQVGKEGHGVHAFLVPIRADDGRPMTGVTIEDCGLKAGLNGVDNGRLYFDQVHIPRSNLLNHFADVSADGIYSSAIPSASRRFFTMLGTLVAGRISIACASCSVAKLSLTIATRYAAGRRQFGPEGQPEVAILSYQNVQHQLLPRIAATFALDAALHALAQRYAVLSSGAGSEDEQRQIEVLAASLKAYASRHALETTQACREIAGGAGYLFENRFGTLREDVDIFTTFEGANPVLQQLVAKGLLSDYKEQFGEMRVRSVIKFLTARASVAVTEQNPITKRRTESDHLRDPEFQAAALRFREQRLLTTVARRLKARFDEGLDSFSAMNACQDHLIALAEAHAEQTIFQSFRARIEAEQSALRAVLEQLATLFALNAIERDRAWFLESDYMETPKTKAIRNEVAALCAELSPSAVALVNAFGIPDAIVRAQIGRE